MTFRKLGQICFTPKCSFPSSVIKLSLVELTFIFVEAWICYVKEDLLTLNLLSYHLVESVMYETKIKVSSGSKSHLHTGYNKYATPGNRKIAPF